MSNYSVSTSGIDTDSIKVNEEVKRVKPWKSFKTIRAEARNDLIKKMASVNYKNIGM